MSFGYYAAQVGLQAIANTITQVALSTTQPEYDPATWTTVGITGVTEPSGGGYTRKTLTSSYWHSQFPGTRVFAYDGDVTFPVPTDDWGTIGWFVLYDSAGRAVAFGDLADPVTVSAGPDQIRIGGGMLTIGLPE